MIMNALSVPNLLGTLIVYGKVNADAKAEAPQKENV